MIFRLAWAAKPRTALVTAPTFAEYAAALESAGCAVRRHFLQAEVDFAVSFSLFRSIHDLHQLKKACSQQRSNAVRSMHYTM